MVSDYFDFSLTKFSNSFMAPPQKELGGGGDVCPKCPMLDPPLHVMLYNMSKGYCMGDYHHYYIL